MLKSRKMKDIKLKEVSLVDRPANLRPFLMYKQEGKPDGSQLLGNKNANILKGENNMDPRIANLIKKFFGDKEVKVEKSELNEATIVEIEKALTTINEYREEMPNDLVAAIGMLGIQAGQGYNSVAKADDIEKKGAKLSKDTLNKLKAIIASAQALLPKEASEDDGDETKKADEVEKMVKSLTDTVAELTGKLEKKESTEQLEGISKTLGEITERLKKVESKPAATKKSIDGNEELNDDGTPVKKDTGLKWPSLSAPAD